MKNAGGIRQRAWGGLSMTFRMIALAAALGLATTVYAAPPVAAPAAKPMNYDCTKAGNKNKAACKNVVAAPVAAMAPAKPMAAPMAMAPAKAAAPMAMAKPKAAAGPKAYGPNEVAATLKNGKVVHYDCSKAGNKDKKACAGK